ncbi:hypothetical protein DFR58_10151 [Anaerobacterium chartisolvens]|uniref:Uncharacterized protein n=1 Tax=Anaerobacterium chartisolvens TaxID=1297424 RepID=A0A369BH19_9FIRM|nr:hypothetical protein [Anaerobacterium chartisolvens]RCX20849.1 hypothetical protein DFR58_10151 [Anaerobacterium chartisolvens]
MSDLLKETAKDMLPELIETLETLSVEDKRTVLQALSDNLFCKYSKNYGHVAVELLSDGDCKHVNGGVGYILHYAEDAGNGYIWRDYWHTNIKKIIAKMKLEDAEYELAQRYEDIESLRKDFDYARQNPHLRSRVLRLENIIGDLQESFDKI